MTGGTAPPHLIVQFVEFWIHLSKFQNTRYYCMIGMSIMHAHGFRHSQLRASFLSTPESDCPLSYSTAVVPAKNSTIPSTTTAPSSKNVYGQRPINLATVSGPSCTGKCRVCLSSCLSVHVCDRRAINLLELHLRREHSRNNSLPVCLSVCCPPAYLPTSCFSRRISK